MTSLADLSGDWRARQRAIADLPNWESLSLGALADQLVELVQEHNRELGTLNAAVQVLAKLGQPALTKLAPLLSHPLVEVRLAAGVVLGQLPDGLGVPLLLGMLDDKDVNVRFHAIEGLGMQGMRSSAPALLAWALDEDFFLSFAAVEALGKLGDVGVVPELCQLLGDDLRREVAAEALARLPHPVALPPVLAALESGLELASAVAILDAISATFDDREGWRGLLARHLSPSRLQLLTALLLPPPLRSAQARLLASLPETPDGTALLRTAELDPEVILRAPNPSFEALSKLLNEYNPQWKARAARALGAQADPRAVPILLQHLDYPQALVRQAVVQAGVSMKAYPTELEEALLSPQATRRGAAVRWFGQQSGERVIARLIQVVCEDGEDRVRCEALEALAGRVQEAAPLVLPVLHQRLTQGTPAERASVARSLNLLPGAWALPLVREALAGGDLWTRIYGSRAAAALGLSECLAELRGLLSDPSPPVRAEAARAMARLAPEQREELLALLGDLDPNVVAATLEVAGSIPSARNRVLELCNSTQPGLRLAALSALGAFSGPDVEALLGESLRNPEERGAAVEALLSSSSPWARQLLLEHFEQLGYQRRRVAEHLSQADDLPTTSNRAVRLALLEVGRSPGELESFLQDSDSWIRRLALLGMCVPNLSEDRRPQVVRLAAQDPDPSVRLVAALVASL